MNDKYSRRFIEPNQKDAIRFAQSVARGKTGAYQLAEDAVQHGQQAAFAHDKHSPFELNSDYRKFLFDCIHNFIRKDRRSRSVATKHAGHIANLHQQRQAEPLLPQQLWAVLTDTHQIMTELSSEEMNIVRLRFEDDLTYAVIAQKLGCSKGSIAGKLKAILAKVRRGLN